ncbi:hypothetical protein RIF29_12447 [Crotalaria pallida]|uniref:Uncharacterized protein n=1 Tax=Crotalaria pallida TaxID=3830 RepID=A0AAN9IN86_CROPI
MHSHHAEDSLRATGIQGVEVGTELYVSNLDHGVTKEDIRVFGTPCPKSKFLMQNFGVKVRSEFVVISK